MRYVDLHHAPRELLYSMIRHNLSTNEVDTLGTFPLASIQLKLLIVGVYYFIKWIEAEDVAKIIAERVLCFYWKKIMC